jgi:hypothetical protein
VNGSEGKPAGHGKQEAIYDAAFQTPTPPDCKATLCPLDDNVSEAENILKTKGLETGFSKNEAENILIIKPLTKNCRNPKIA